MAPRGTTQSIFAPYCTVLFAPYLHLMLSQYFAINKKRNLDLFNYLDLFIYLGLKNANFHSYNLQGRLVTLSVTGR